MFCTSKRLKNKLGEEQPSFLDVFIISIIPHVVRVNQENREREREREGENKEEKEERKKAETNEIKRI